jgi:long-chain acyl-CoA synthetase
VCGGLLAPFAVEALLQGLFGRIGLFMFFPRLAWWIDTITEPGGGGPGVRTSDPRQPGAIAAAHRFGRAAGGGEQVARRASRSGQYSNTDEASMQKIWLDSYPPDVPAHIKLEKCVSLAGLLKWVCGGYGGQKAFSNQGTSLDWCRVDELSRHFAAWLHKAGLGKGDRVAIMLPNLLQYPVALFGVLRLGCVVVNVNPQSTARELQHQLADSGAEAIIVLDNFAHKLEQVMAQTRVRHVVTTGVGDLLHFPKAQIVNLAARHVHRTVPGWHIAGSVSLHHALEQGAGLVLPEVALVPGDVAFLQYTSGSSGVPKGAMLTHGNVVANIEQTAVWVRGHMTEGEETAVIPLPLHHILALTAMLAFCRLGAHIVLVTNPRDIPGFIKELRHTSFTALIGVNTLYEALLDAPDIGTIDCSAMKVVVAGGMALQRSVAERWHRLFGVPIVEGYGLTEASAMVCANRLDIRAWTGSVGLPVPSTEVALLDDEGHELPLGQIGEIGVRGPQVMQGYWNRPDDTRRAFAPGGWLRTGDMGFMNEQGYVKLLDRKSDTIKVGGVTVFPREVEEVVALHPGVFEVAAIAAPGAQGQDVVKIVVVRRNAALSAEELIEYCKKNLSFYKVPAQVAFRADPLPKSSVGKVLRRVVAEQDAQPTAGVQTPRAHVP